jgi:N-acylneuraminate cytidylyltransferase
MNINKKNIVCIIPARGGSKGIPGKNILNIAGKPLIAWSIEQARSSKYLNGNVYVTSNCDEILDISLKHGANIIKRPEDISGDKATSESALVHALGEIGKIVKDIELVVFLQATSPLREDKDIDNAIETVIEKGYDSLFSAIELHDFFIWTYDNSNNLKSLNYDYRNRKRRQDVKEQYVENGSIYVFKPEILLRDGNRLGGKIGISVMEPWKVHEIDTMDNIELCEFYLRNKILKQKIG